MVSVNKSCHSPLSLEKCVMQNGLLFQSVAWKIMHTLCFNITFQIICAFWLVLAYDLWEDRHINDKICSVIDDIKNNVVRTYQWHACITAHVPLFVLITFWPHLWSITELVQGIYLLYASRALSNEFFFHPYFAVSIIQIWRLINCCSGICDYCFLPYIVSCILY